MKPSEVIREARAQLFETGWTQRSGRDRKTGAVCALQALEDAGGYNPSVVDAEMYLCNALDENDVITWNDHNGRTFTEVIDAFDRAEKLALVAEESELA